MSDRLHAKIEHTIKQLERRYGVSADRSAFHPLIRNQGKNRDGISLTYALLSLFDDIKPFVLGPVLNGEFGLMEKFGIDPSPLYNLNSPGNVEKVFESFFGMGMVDVKVDLEALLNDLLAIKNRGLLGSNTPGKMAYVEAVTGTPLQYLNPEKIERSALELQANTIEMLRRQESRRTTAGVDSTEINAMVRKMSIDFLLHKLKVLFFDYSKFATGTGNVYQVYADEITQILGEYVQSKDGLANPALNGLKFLKKQGVEVAFAPRNRRYVYSGDKYGECTANKVRSQVDPKLANIHWTVYSWALDPHYQILDVYCDGDNVLKGHVVPLIIDGRSVLMLDAIECVPQLRKIVRGKSNPYLSERLYLQKEEILDKLFETTKGLAILMGVEAVYIDRFSNATWIRNRLNKLPSDAYHVSNVEKPFGFDIAKHAVTRALGHERPEVAAEIQAWNLLLMDQQLRAGYKEISVLMGLRKGYRLPIRGV